MGSPLGLLMANAFMCNIKERTLLTKQTKIPTFYKCYIDNTLSIMPDVQAASTFSQHFFPLIIVYIFLSF